LSRAAQLRGMVAELERVYRAGSGNPHHDAEGKFTSAGGEGSRHAHRAKRRKRKARAIRKRHKAELAETKLTHREERRDRVKDERREHRELSREHAKERKALGREHAKERASKERSQVKERASWEKKSGKERERAGKQQGKKSEKLDRAEKSAKGLPRRQERERAKLEEHIASGEHARVTGRVADDLIAKAKASGKPEHEIKALEARRDELIATGAQQSRERLALQHEAQRQKAEGLPGLRQRLTKQTAAKLKRIESRPARLARHHAKQLKAQERRQAGERREQRQEHREARQSLRQDQREERQSIRETHREERHEARERYDEELSEHGFRRKKKAVNDGGVRGGVRGGGMLDPVLPDSLSPLGTRPVDVTRRFSPMRTVKASSAEAILRHALRGRGWSSAWRRGELSGKQQLDLLADIREYSRAWLHHEAESFIRHYGRPIDDGAVAVPRGAGDGDRAGGADGDAVVRTLGSAVASHLRRWFGRVRSFVRESIVAGALALTGPAPLSGDDLNEAERHVAVQEQYLERFRLDVETRPPAEIAEPSPFATDGMTAAQFAARAEQYGDAVWGAAQQVERVKMIRGRRYIAERRLHGLLIDDLCDVCREQVALGWQPVGTLRPIGDSDCKTACHCYFQYRDAEGQIAKQVRKMRGRLPRLTRRPVVEG
jgi:hypothetical protein